MSECAQPFADPDIETLSEVLNPGAFAEHLRSASLYSDSEGGIKEVQSPRVLKHHPGNRCALEVSVRTAEGWHSLIAKIYHKDRSDVFEAMKGIQQSGFGPQDEFSIPQPIAYISSLQCMLLEKVDGSRVDEILKNGDEQIKAAAAERCALWLARFHALAPKAGEVSYPHDFLNSKSMQRYSREIAERGGICADKAASLLQRLEDELPSLSHVKMCAGHGSYSASHALLVQGRTVVFDWDGYDVANPARDVARFLGTLRRSSFSRNGSVNTLDGTAEVFLKTYLAAGRPEVARDLHFFEAATCLNLAKHSLCRQVDSVEGEKKRKKAEAMLDEGFAILDRVTVN